MKDPPDPSAFPVLVSVALVGPLLACAALHLARDVMAPADAALALVLVVVGVAASGRRAAGVVAALSCAVWFDFFLTEPYLTFSISDRDDVETAVLLTVVGVAVSEIAQWGRRQQARSSRRAGHLDGLVAAAGMVAAGDEDPETVASFVGQQVAAVLGVSSCVFHRGGPGRHPRLERDGSVTLDGRSLDVDRTGLPTFDVVELPVASADRVHGRFVLTNPAYVVWSDPEQRRVAVILADQAAAAFASAPGARRPEVVKGASEVSQDRPAGGSDEPPWRHDRA